MKLNDILDIAKNKTGNNTKLAEKLGLEKGSISNYRKKRNSPSLEVYFRLGIITEINPLMIIIYSKLEEATTAEELQTWEEFKQHFT
jgi:transcriptional regulator with XRE-family HTH domain